MAGREPERRTLAELAAETGVPARTIRYYIARGILPGPGSAGRTADYGPEHAERLGRVREMQQRGLTLAEIAAELGGASRTMPEPAPWWQYPVAEGVVVMVKGDLPPWRLRGIRRAVAEMTAKLQTDEGDNG